MLTKQRPELEKGRAIQTDVVVEIQACVIHESEHVVVNQAMLKLKVVVEGPVQFLICHTDNKDSR